MRVLAIFEMPAVPGDCSHCDCALAATDAIFAALRDLNENRPLPGGPLEVTIALHEGRVAFGNIGSVERQDFTVIGQDVNMAARLGALAAQLGLPLLLSERVASRSPVALRKVGEFPLKGFSTPQSVYAPASAARLVSTHSGSSDESRHPGSTTAISAPHGTAASYRHRRASGGRSPFRA